MNKVVIPKLHQIPYRSISSRISRKKSQITADSHHSPTKRSILKQPSDFTISSFLKRKAASTKKVTINPIVEIKEIEVITCYSYKEPSKAKSTCGKCLVF